MTQLEKLKDWIEKRPLTKDNFFLLKEIYRLESKEEFCEWKRSEFFNEYKNETIKYYRLQCNKYEINENEKANYCPYCGRKIKEVQ